MTAFFLLIIFVTMIHFQLIPLLLLFLVVFGKLVNLRHHVLQRSLFEVQRTNQLSVTRTISVLLLFLILQSQLCQSLFTALNLFRGVRLCQHLFNVSLLNIHGLQIHAMTVSCDDADWLS